MQEQANSNIKNFKVRVGSNVPGNAPKISVIIPAYNTAEYIAETIDSVMRQTFRDYEIIVVNDGSPDSEHLERELEPYLDGIVYISQTNAGAGPARNSGIIQSRGDIIAFLDGDDIWYDNFLNSQNAFLEANNYDLVYCDAELFGLHLMNHKTFMQSAPSFGIADFDSLLDSQCNIITSGTIARKQAIVNAGMFEPERVYAEDFHLWLRIAKIGSKIGYQRKPLLKYRVRIDSLSGDSVSRVKRSIEVFGRVERAINVTEEQRRRINLRISGFEADLDIERGKMFLLSGKFPDAADAFGKANVRRRSLKLTIISILCRIAPQILVKLYVSRRSTDIEFVPDSEKSG